MILVRPTSTSSRNDRRALRGRFAVLTAVIALLLSSPPSWSQDLLAAIDAAFLSNDVDAAVSLVERAQAAVEAEESLRNQYTLNYARYRAATFLFANPQRGREAALLLEAAQEGLQQSLDGLRDSLTAKSKSGRRMISEFESLLAGVMGMRIGVQPALAMRLGMKSQSHLSGAIEADSKNPRAHLQAGISAFNTPAMWGGGHKKAEEALREAVSLFAGSKTKEGEWPTWGYLDALAWLGQALAEQGQIDQARAAYQQALAIDPEMGWIRYDLLPKLEERVSN